jgi:predicted ATPase/DNA-binding winged helix-turn-helix (wHTH) protein
MPVRLGGRALDLLLALVESAGEIVSKKDLLARVWPGVIVEEGSLRFHMVAVRKALGDGEGGRRYIVNIANKGYTFVGVVERRESNAQGEPHSRRLLKSLPAVATATVGRDGDIDVLVAKLLQRRLVSVVGSGGIGKTTVAIASAHAAESYFEGDVHFVDLSPIAEAQLVLSSVAAAVGLQNRVDGLRDLAAHVGNRKTLVVLDCCEHVITAAAELAEVLVSSCPNVHILATSREPLRAEGELVYRLPPLPFPPEGEGTTTEAALAFPAVRLFVDRAAAADSGFELTDADAPLASQLCRELDGIALAIELAAGRIEALGLEAVVAHLDASVRLMWHGRRTAVPRHQTLGATLDWSFNLLADGEKRVLRRLSVFPETFSLAAAVAVCGFDHETSQAIELIANLVSKSLVVVDAGGASLRYRLLDSTKSYCWRKLCDLGEEMCISEHFCNYFDAWAQLGIVQPLAKDAIENLRLELPSLRATLEWHFRDGATSHAVRLAASVCPLLLQLSQLTECARWAQAALAQMPPTFVGSHWEVQLQGALGSSLIYSTGSSVGEAETAFKRSIEVAKRLRDSRSTVQLLNGYTLMVLRDGRYSYALSTAREAQSLLADMDDQESRAAVDAILGWALHLTGDVGEALQHWEHCIPGTAPSDLTSMLGFDYRIRALCGLARGLWLTGHYAKAVAMAENAIAHARDSGHAVTHCIALLWAGSVFTYYGNDAERSEELVATLERVATRHSLVPYLNVANITRGQMLIAQGRPAEGVERIRRAVEVLHACRYELVTSVSLTIMAKGLADLSFHSASLEVCGEVARMIEAGGDFLRMPELLYTRGRCLAAAGQRDQAAKSYLSAIDLARSQGVKSSQVRSAVALAEQLVDAGRLEEAQLLLRPHVDDAAGEVSPDLFIARSLLT